MLERLTTAQKLTAALILAAVVGIASWSAFGGAGDSAAPASAGDVTYTVPDAAAVALTVHVVGEVRQPGLYTLPAGSRVCNAIECAGGLTAQARADSVNLAAYLEDGQQVRVEAVPQPEPPPAPAPVAAAPVAPQPAPLMPAPARPPAPTAQPTGQPAFAQTQPQHRVRLNSAGLEELQRIEGIGPELAKNILAYRAMNGPFRSIEALDEVPGIGPATVERIRVSASLN